MNFVYDDLAAIGPGLSLLLKVDTLSEGQLAVSSAFVNINDCSVVWEDDDYMIPGYYASMAAGIVVYDGGRKAMASIASALWKNGGLWERHMLIRSLPSRGSTTPVQESDVFGVIQSQDQLQIRIADSRRSTVSLSLCDNIGRLIDTYVVSSDDYVINLNSIATGTYTLVGSDEDGRTNFARVLILR